MGINEDLEAAVLSYLRSSRQRYESLQLSAEPTQIRLKAFDQGQSNPTYLMTVDPGSAVFVLRKQPAGQLLKTAHDVTREAKIMRMLNENRFVGVPVPRVFLIEEDANQIGTTFFIMEYIEGVIHRDPSLPDVASAEQRRTIYKLLAQVLAAIHGVSSSSSVARGYSRKQLELWVMQYNKSLVPELGSNRDIATIATWLKDRLPLVEGSEAKSVSCRVHGDFRLDNVIFSKDNKRVLAVLDWELASPHGQSLADLAYCSLGFILPKVGFFSDLALGPALPAGIPSAEEFFLMYAAGSRPAPPLCGADQWVFFQCLGLLRIASICQGVFARAVQGNASSSRAGSFREAVPLLAKRALDLIKALPSSSFSSSSPTLALKKKLADFINDEVLPAEAELTAHLDRAVGAWPDRGSRWVPHPRMLELAERARRQYGLWNLWLPKHLAKRLVKEHSHWDWSSLLPHGPDQALSNEQYAALAVESGRSLFTPALINCAAPDTGNMELIATFGTSEQRERWLLPLLSGAAKSCFAMTEVEVSSSDPTQLQATAELSADGSEWVLNGRKWWTTGACDPRCSVCVFVARTRTLASDPPHRRHSIFLVPMDSPGITVVRPLYVFGFDDAPGGHAEVVFQSVRMPVFGAMLGKPGMGFELAQSRLGPGRLHHCARLVGHGQRALAEIVRRGSSRRAFGKSLLDLGGNSERLALSSISVNSALLSVQAAARELDACDEKLTPAAIKALAVCKVLVPRATQEALDFTVQLHGGGGLSTDHPLAAMWAAARTLRLVDGPDEVHLRTVAKLELKEHAKAHPGVGQSRL